RAATTAVSRPRYGRLSAGAAPLAPVQITFGRPLRGSFYRRAETEDGAKRSEHPAQKIDDCYRERESGAAGELKDGAGLAALGLGEARHARHVARTLRKLKTFKRGPGASLRAHTSDIAHHGHDALRALKLDGIAGEAQSLRGRRD